MSDRLEDRTRNRAAPSSALKSIIGDVEALREYAKHFVDARVDRVKASVRRALLVGFAVSIGLITLAAVSIVAVVFAFSGVAEGIGILCGGRPWLGDLIAGGGGLLFIAGGGALIAITWRRRRRRRLLRKYRERRAVEEMKFAAGRWNGKEA